MDRNNFFSILPCTVLSLSASILLLFYSTNAFCKNSTYKVINVKNVVRLEPEKEKNHRDFFVNYGSSDGAKTGGALKVDRRVLKHSEIDGIPDKIINIPIGVLKIISVEEDSCVARLVSLDDRAKEPLAVHDTAMIGDIVTPIKDAIKKKEVVILPETILFDFDKYFLRKEAKDALSRLAVKIAANGYEKIEIESHTDSIGSRDYNLRLSERRARSIFDYFTKTLKLPKGLFKVKGYGESRPVAGNKTKKDRQKNRRGVITLFK